MPRNDTPASDEWPAKGRKKDTKRWCKGKPGREHAPVVQLNRHTMTYQARHACGSDDQKWDNGDGTYGWLDCNHVEVCSACGKNLGSATTCPDTGRTIR